ncbi:MAG: hypothetical protein HON53_18545 [Planctomycetaceae bacterium]|nr:hypothetical protein [Planctomycetaceae bacterium]
MGVVRGDLGGRIASVFTERVKFLRVGPTDRRHPMVMAGRPEATPEL